MNRKARTLLHLLILMSIALGACQSSVTTQVEAGEKGLDATYTTFLGDMVLYNTIALDDLNRMLAEESPPFLLDVREVDEVLEEGHIEGAVVIPLRDLGKRTDRLPSFDTKIVSYCGGGWRCTIAMVALEVLGWQNVYSLAGGSFGGWVEAGYPIATGLPDAATLNAASPDPSMLKRIDETLTKIPDELGAISVDAVNIDMMTNPDLVLLDVRQPGEVQKTGTIEGAIQIPLEDLIARKVDWPTDKTSKIVIFSQVAYRSIIAMTILWSYGYSDVWTLIG
jgi:rhodanese-related sulfurtransferase